MDEARRRGVACCWPVIFPETRSSPGRDAARHRRALGLLGANAVVANSRRGPMEAGPAESRSYPLSHDPPRQHPPSALSPPARRDTRGDHRRRETQLGNEMARAENTRIDRRRPHALPHTFLSGESQRLRSALEAGIAHRGHRHRIHAPAPGGGQADRVVPFLGGLLTVDLSVLRLARLAGVPARPIFVTIPGERLTVTTGDPLARGPRRGRDPVRGAARPPSRAGDSPAGFRRFHAPIPPIRSRLREGRFQSLFLR